MIPSLSAAIKHQECIATHWTNLDKSAMAGPKKEITQLNIALQSIWKQLEKDCAAKKLLSATWNFANNVIPFLSSAIKY